MAAAAGASSSSSSNIGEPSTDAHQELLTEHFGFNPRVFIDALVFAANELLYNIGAQFEEDFAQKEIKRENKRIKKRGNGEKLIDPTEAERGTHAILTLLENALDHTFDLLELYCLKTVFGIRPSEAKCMTLAHHRGLDLRTAEERVKDGALSALSAKEESLELQDKETLLRKRIAKAKQVRHALRLANTSADRSLARTQELSDTFSNVFLREDGAAQLPSTLPQSAIKLSADASSLLISLKALIGTNALGSSLVAPPGTKKASAKDRKRVMDESGASEHDKKEVWEMGRERYINWEFNRVLQNLKDRQKMEIGDLSVVSTPGSYKRRKTDEPRAGHSNVLGDADELEEVATLLGKR